METVVSECSDFLQSHANRDKVISLASYVLKLWGSTSSREPLLRMSARLALARVTTRLFDDATVLKAFMNYGLGKQEGCLWGTLGVAGYSFTLAYLQLEKVVLMMDTGVVVLSKQADLKCRIAHKLFWALFATIGLLRSFRALHTAALELKEPKPRKCAAARFTAASLNTTKLLFDVIHSVSWLPRGCLWGGRLSGSQTSGVATVSAVLAIVIHCHGKKLLPAKDATKQ